MKSRHPNEKHPGYKITQYPGFKDLKVYDFVTKPYSELKQTDPHLAEEVLALFKIRTNKKSTCVAISSEASASTSPSVPPSVQPDGCSDPATEETAKKDSTWSLARASNRLGNCDRSRTNYFDHGKCPRVFAGHMHFHMSRICGEILTLASDEMATQVDFLFVLILRSLEESEDFFSQVWVSLFQFRIWLSHEVVNFEILESWVLSDLVPWMLLVRVTGLDVPEEICGVFAHVTTLTADEAATNVYTTSLSFILVIIEDKFSSFLVFLLELAERDALE